MADRSANNSSAAAGTYGAGDGVEARASVSASQQIYDAYRARRPLTAPFRRAGDMLKEERGENAAMSNNTSAISADSGAHVSSFYNSSLPIGRPLAMPGLRGGAGAAHMSALGNGGNGYRLGSPSAPKRPATALLRGSTSNAFDASGGGSHATNALYTSSYPHHHLTNQADADSLSPLETAATEEEAPAPTPAQEPFISDAVLRRHHGYLSDVLVGLWASLGMRSNAERYSGWSSPSPSIVLAVCTPQAVKELQAAVLRLLTEQQQRMEEDERSRGGGGSRGGLGLLAASSGRPTAADVAHHEMLFGPNDPPPQYRAGLIRRVVQLVSKKLAAAAEAKASNTSSASMAASRGQPGLGLLSLNSLGGGDSSLAGASAPSADGASRTLFGVTGSPTNRGGLATARPHTASSAGRSSHQQQQSSLDADGANTSGALAVGLSPSNAGATSASEAPTPTPTLAPAARPQSASVYRPSNYASSLSMPPPSTAGGTDEHIRRVGPPAPLDSAAFSHSADGPYAALTAPRGASADRDRSRSADRQRQQEETTPLRTAAATPIEYNNNSSNTTNRSGGHSPVSVSTVGAIRGGGVGQRSPSAAVPPPLRSLQQPQQRSPSAYRHRLAIVHTQSDTVEKGTAMTPRGASNASSGAATRVPSTANISSVAAPTGGLEDGGTSVASAIGDGGRPLHTSDVRANWYHDARAGVDASSASAANSGNSSSTVHAANVSAAEAAARLWEAEWPRTMRRLSSDEDEGRAVVDALQDALRERVRKLMAKEGSRLWAVEAAYSSPATADGKGGSVSRQPQPVPAAYAAAATSANSGPPTRRPSEVAQLRAETSQLMGLYAEGLSPVRARHTAKEAKEAALAAIERAETDDRLAIALAERTARTAEASRTALVAEEAEGRAFIFNELEPQSREDIRFKMHYAGMDLFPEERAVVTAAYLEQYKIECEEAADRKALQTAIRTFLASEVEGHRAEDAAIAIQTVFRRYVDGKALRSYLADLEAAANGPQTPEEEAPRTGASLDEEEAEVEVEVPEAAPILTTAAPSPLTLHSQQYEDEIAHDDASSSSSSSEAPPPSIPPPPVPQSEEPRAAPLLNESTLPHTQPASEAGNVRHHHHPHHHHHHHHGGADTDVDAATTATGDTIRTTTTVRHQRRNDAAAKIQRAARGHSARRARAALLAGRDAASEALRREEAAVRIQALARGVAARHYVGRRRAEREPSVYTVASSVAYTAATSHHAAPAVAPCANSRVGGGGQSESGAHLLNQSTATSCLPPAVPASSASVTGGRGGTVSPPPSHLTEEALRAQQKEEEGDAISSRHAPPSSHPSPSRSVVSGHSTLYGQRALGGEVAGGAIAIAEGIRFAGGAPSPLPSVRGGGNASISAYADAATPQREDSERRSVASTTPTVHRAAMAGGVAGGAIAGAEGIRFAGGAPSPLPSVRGGGAMSLAAGSDIAPTPRSVRGNGNGQAFDTRSVGSGVSSSVYAGHRAAVATRAAGDAIVVAEGIRFAGGAPSPLPSVRGGNSVAGGDGNESAAAEESVSPSHHVSSKRSSIMAASAAAAGTHGTTPTPTPAPATQPKAPSSTANSSGGNRSSNTVNARPATATAASTTTTGGSAARHSPPRAASASAAGSVSNNNSATKRLSGGAPLPLPSSAASQRSAGTSTIVRHARINAVLEFIDAMERIKADEGDVRAMLEEDELFGAYVCQCHWPRAFPIPLVEHAQPQDFALLCGEEGAAWQHLMETEHAAMAYAIQRAAVEEVRRSTTIAASSSSPALSLAPAESTVGAVVAVDSRHVHSSRPSSAKRLMDALRSSSSDSAALRGAAAAAGGGDPLAPKALGKD